jgi:hypothetical protein
LYAEFDAAIAGEEFDGYRQRRADIEARFAGEVDRLRDELAEHARRVDEGRRLIRWNYWTFGRVVRVLMTSPGVSSRLLQPVVMLLSLACVVGAIVTNRWDVRLAFSLLAGSSGLGYAGFLNSSIAAQRASMRSARDELQAAESTYSQERARLVREAVRRQVTEVFRESGVITFPMLAPTLVELSNAKITSSRTHNEVIDFVRSHETSAIGIAGSRGSGKSTLMEAVRTADGLASHHVHLTAPVKYDSLDFVRRLFADVAKEIVTRSGHPVENVHDAHRRRFARQRMLRDVLTLGILSVLAVVIFLWGLDNYDWAWDWRTTVGFAGAAVLVAVISATVMSLGRTLSRSAGVRSALFNAPRSVRLAAEALDDLVWTREEGQKETGSSALLGGLFTVGGEDNVTRKRRELSQPELVARFRELFTQFSQDRPDGDRFVVFIDELDKLDDIDDLVNAINGIKDLLHLPGVHFVVSVSVDALVRFEERGLAARDAFDSAFDTVIRMRPLTLDESRSILSSRAANFPALLVLCCHAWSGGLARDLLRTARRCVEIQRRSSEVLHVSEIMMRMVTEDMLAHIENALRAAPDDGVDHLIGLRHAVRGVAASADPIEELRLRVIVETSRPSQIDYVTRAGLALLGFVFGAQADDRRWEQPPSDWDPCVEALAAAMSARAEPAAIRNETLENAVGLVLAAVERTARSSEAS